jgi:CHASE3 domain sensor protein
LQQSLLKLKESTEKQLNEYKLAVGTADSIFLEALTNLEEHVKGQFVKLTAATDAQQESFKKSLLAIEKALQGKLQETSSLLEELKNLTEIKKAVGSFEKIIDKQNVKIDDLTKSIKDLAQIKTSGEIKVISESPKIPQWLKISIIAGGSIIVLSSLFSIIMKIIALFGIDI